MIDLLEIKLGWYQRGCFLSLEIIGIIQAIADLGGLSLRMIFGEGQILFGSHGKAVNFRRFLEQEKLSKFFMKKCGFISIIGKTNVGKSTFLNNFIGKKISITSKTVQTTRSNIFAVETRGKNQMVFIDTPGVHGNINKTVNKYLRKKTLENLLDIDVIIFMISGSMFTQVDQKALNLIKESKAKKLFVMNKIDLVKNKGDLFKFVDDFEHKDVFEAFLPISAEKIDGFQKVKDRMK